MNVIETIGLTKSFGDTNAVNDVSLHVKKGEIYGFLGLNGAGKTTTIRLLLGLIKANKGECILFGQGPRNTSMNRIGYLIETPYSYPNLSVRENLEVILRLRGIHDKSAIDNIIDRLKLGSYRNRKEKNLSLGNKQRLGIAKALIHEPELLILDEPINGLDPAGIVEVRELLLKLARENGTTIFLSSHILSEIAKLTSRIGIIHDGKLVKEINNSDLPNQIIRKLQINTCNNEDALKLLEKKGFTAVLSDKVIDIRDKNAIENPENITALLSASGLPPGLVNVFEEDLEHYFLRVLKEYESC